jgi:hypothetical protein
LSLSLSHPTFPCNPEFLSESGGRSPSICGRRTPRCTVARSASRGVRMARRNNAIGGARPRRDMNYAPGGE